jgi:hypothetical protein
MLTRGSRIALALLMLLAACATGRQNPAERYKRCGAVLASGTLTTDWLSDRAYIDVAEAQRERGCYPVTLVGVQGTTGMLYRSAFKPQPSNIAIWRYEIGISPGQAREMDGILAGKGYAMIWHDITTDASGAVRMQIVWTKSVVGLAAR